MLARLPRHLKYSQGPLEDILFGLQMAYACAVNDC